MLLKYLRSEQKFNSLDDLTSQLELDKATATNTSTTVNMTQPLNINFLNLIVNHFFFKG
jgi:hypothetical protein